MSNVFQELSEEFDALCQQRHEMGQKKYGPISFLDRDTIGDILEEITDAANYLRYFYIKMRLLENEVLQRAQEPNQIGIESFKSMNKDT